ncbi:MULTISPECIES: hypothetical protein [Rhodococcus]|jgi:hypothetical protein|uniref:Uncharacterized protein n=1 Tax=Rhodococcus erythropolis (strain PR4 / NBRC 100887) TaxID=234621 RepID=Q3L9Z9_RHOE4|nr:MULTISPECIES: hypothetical protein [Rhodococcus]MCY4671887.1 hypothetical protein [Rhodococcus sp. (in: high G+C Gram-positive bacteria)]MBF7737348.1 hypothetical protein [Rhodococcus erythropolis]MBY6388715.1 hypothetical protein [Rhodococcus erythropolis]MCZ4570068.1 hypothetical protein [Rhodococcus erythropolis]MCZ4644877.1 hypothetical protein [Rhodococcus erythropolis]
MNDDNNVEVIKDFTTARKIPQLIGRTPDGKKLPFGPYTVPQAVSGAAVGAILWLLHPLWLGDNITWNVGFFVACCGGTVFVVGKLRLAGRSPASVAQGVKKAVFAPPEAKLKINGKRVNIRAPHLVHAGGYITADPRIEDQLVAAVEPESPSESVPVAHNAVGTRSRPHEHELPALSPNDPAPRPGRSSVKELLALANAGNPE